MVKDRLLGTGDRPRQGLTFKGLQEELVVRLDELPRGLLLGGQPAGIASRSRRLAPAWTAVLVWSHRRTVRLGRAGGAATVRSSLTAGPDTSRAAAGRRRDVQPPNSPRSELVPLRSRWVALHAAAAVVSLKPV